jgi:Tol biopolymer transport system component
LKRLFALLLVLAIAPAAYPFGQNKIVYDKFHWQIYHSTHFDIYFYDEEKPSLQRVVDMAESAYDYLSRTFNYQISKKIPIIYYATHSAFEQSNVDLNFIPEGVGAFAEPTKNRMVLPIDTTDEKLLQLVQHEMTHVFEYEILFQGKLGKQVTANPPTWFMEGLASFMGQDEDSKDRMVLRDAVVNDHIPSITRNPDGYFAYRFGHAVFKYIQQKYGWEGLRDFIYEYRNTLGSSVDRALKRALEVTPEEFDTHFRTWMRKQYLPALVAKGEPIEYGEPFRINTDVHSDETSPTPSPSGDLIAGFTTYKDDIDVVLFRINDRKMWRNLTAGYTSKYEYPVVQAFTIGPVMGRDMAFSPNGDHVAFFVKKERGRNLVIMNPLTGAIERSTPLPVEQELSPAYSPDGGKIAFAGFVGSQDDIFLYDINSGDTTNVTKDAYFDGAPVFSPDGKWIVYSSIVDGYAKLFKLNVSNPTERYQLTTGKWNDIDAWFSPDGKRVFFASDKQTGRDAESANQTVAKAPAATTDNAAGTMPGTMPAASPATTPASTPDEAPASKADLAEKRESDAPPPDSTNFAAYNIYSLNLATGDVLQYTDVVGGCFMPVVFTGSKGKERLVFASYYKGQWRLFSTTTDHPLHGAEKTTLSSVPLLAESRTKFVPPVEVAIDPEKIENTSGSRLFVEDVAVNAGVTSDQLFVSQSVLYMSDMLGNRRFIASLNSVSSFSDFDFLYLDLHRRWNWGVRLYDNRSFFNAIDQNSNRVQRGQQDYRETGLLGLFSYPFTRYHRIDFGAGFQSRDINYPIDSAINSDTGEITYIFFQRRDNFPFVTASFSGDNTRFKEFGPIAGRRYTLSTDYAPDLKEKGTLTADTSVDWRQYIPITSRSLFAARVFAGYSRGNFSNFYYFGGLNTLRGYDFQSLIGNRAAFANLELRFPLIDLIAFPGIAFQGIRGNLFFDIGAANFKGTPFQFINNHTLVDGKASAGWGISFSLFGLELHWDVARRYDLKHFQGGKKTEFWIGETF